VINHVINHVIKYVNRPYKLNHWYLKNIAVKTH